MPAPSWNLAIIVFFLIGIVFGYILQREKIIATLLSVYVGLVVSQLFSGSVFDFFQGNRTLFNQVWVRANASPFTIRVIVFLAIIAILSAKGGISGTKSKGLLSPIEIIILSFLTCGLILSSIFYFLPPETREAFMSSSHLVSLVIRYYPLWVLAPIVALVGLGFMRKSD